LTHTFPNLFLFELQISVVKFPAGKKTTDMYMLLFRVVKTIVIKIVILNLVKLRLKNIKI